MYFKKDHKCENCTLPFNIVWNCKIGEQKIMKELYESDFHEITWDKKCVLRNKDYIEYLLIPRHPIFFSYLKSPVTLIFSIIEPLKSFSNLSKVYLTALKPDAFALTSSF